MLHILLSAADLFPTHIPQLADGERSRGTKGKVTLHSSQNCKWTASVTSFNSNH